MRLTAFATMAGVNDGDGGDGNGKGDGNGEPQRWREMATTTARGRRRVGDGDGDGYGGVMVVNKLYGVVLMDPKHAQVKKGSRSKGLPSGLKRNYF